MHGITHPLGWVIPCMEDWQIMLTNVVAIMGISYGSAQAILHYNLGYHKVCFGYPNKQEVQMWLCKQLKSFFFEEMKDNRSASTYRRTMSRNDIYICSSLVEIKILYENCVHFLTCSCISIHILNSSNKNLFHKIEINIDQYISGK